MSLFALLILLAFLAGCSSDDPSSPLEAPGDNTGTPVNSNPPSGDQGSVPNPNPPDNNPPDNTPNPNPPDNNPPDNTPNLEDPPQGVDPELEGGGISQMLDGLPTPSGFDPDPEGTFLDVNSFPLEQIFNVLPADNIPALTNPRFVDPDQVSYLDDEDLVLGMVINGEAKAYPHNIGWWHEIVNDRIGGYPVSVTFCPLTGTGLAFDATDENGRQFELGVSGLLFNTNLIMYDRRDNNTLYPQIAFKGIRGNRFGETLTLLPIVETTWGTWKKLHPNTKVIAGGTYSLDRYLIYPYNDYRTNNQYFLFPLTVDLSRNQNIYATIFDAKERVLGVRLDNHAKAYPHSMMGERAVINDEVGAVPITVLWDKEAHLALPYSRWVDEVQQVLTFDIDEDRGFPFGMRDRETGTLWDANGLAVEGPLAGQRLQQIPAHSSMWFAWVTFWQNTEAWTP